MNSSTAGTRKTQSSDGGTVRLCRQEQGDKEAASDLSDRERTGSLRGRKRSGRVKNSSAGTDAGKISSVVYRRQNTPSGITLHYTFQAHAHEMSRF